MTSLGSAVADLLAGRASPREARLRAAQVPDLDEFDAWRSNLADLVTAVLAARDAGRAGDLAGLARAALGLVDGQLAAEMLVEIGTHLGDLENWAAALPCFTAAAQSSGDRGLAAVASLLRLDTLRRLDRDDEVLDLVPEVVARASEADRRDLVIAALTAQARLLRARGEVDAAFRALEEAAELRRDLPDDVSGLTLSQPALLTMLGDYARLGGHFDAAISAFEQAREAAQRVGAAHDAAFALSELGYTYQNAGEADRGTRLLKQAAAEARQLGDLDDAARWDGAPQETDLAGASPATRLQYAVGLVESEPEQALALAREQVRTAVQAGNASLEAEARNVVGGALGKLGQFQQAKLAYRAAHAAAIRAGDLMAQFHALGNLADELFRHIRRDEFEQASVEAIRIGEQLRGSAGSGETRQMIAAATARVYDRMAVSSAATYHPPGEAPPVPPDPARLLDISQRMRGRNLLRWLSVRPYLDTADPAAYRAIVALRTADITIEAMAGEPGAGLAGLIRQRAEAEAAVRSHGAGELLALVTGSEPVVFSPDELAAALRPGELLVDVMSLLDQCVVSCVAPGGRVAAFAFNSRQPDRRTQLVRLRAAREELRLADYRGGLPAAEADYAAAVGPIAGIVAEVASQIAELGPVSRVFVSPQMELFALPWWQLTEHLADIEICILPVPGALPLLRARPASAAPLARLLFIPDATGTLRNPEADVAHVPHETCDGDVSDLLHAMPAASTVHFGGHGHFNQVNAYFSGFVVRQSGEPDPLSRPDPAEPPRPGIGLLTAAQLLARADLPGCDLAVLAACSTGIPRQHAANEFTSLPSALLLAGARSVVASLWNTSDPAVAVIMQEFYAGLTAGQGPVTALANARRTLRVLDRSDVIARLGTDQYVPSASPPFARGIYTDPFQYYGTS